MAAPLMYQVKFKAERELPNIENILLDAMDLTGLTIVATSTVGGERNILWNLTAKRKGKLLPVAMHTQLFNMGAEEQAYILVGSIFDRNSYYLIGSLLFVLTQLGGTYKYSLPDWAGKSWQAVKAEGGKMSGFINPAEIE
jgi:hypothetical protein